MSDRITVETLPNIPYIESGQEIGDILLTAIKSAGIILEENDIICVASKAVSIAEQRQINLVDVEAGEIAKQIHERVPRKDVRTLQLMIDETGKPDGSRLEIQGNYIAGWLPNGLRLTSAGVDKMNAETVILLPENSDESAKRICLLVLLNLNSWSSRHFKARLNRLILRAVSSVSRLSSKIMQAMTKCLLQPFSSLNPGSPLSSMKTNILPNQSNIVSFASLQNIA